MEIQDKELAIAKIGAHLINIAAHVHYDDIYSYKTPDFDKLSKAEFDEIKVKFYVDFKEVDDINFVRALNKGTDIVKIYTVDYFFDNENDIFFRYMFIDNSAYNYVALSAFNRDFESYTILSSEGYNEKSEIIEKLLEEINM